MSLRDVLFKYAQMDLVPLKVIQLNSSTFKVFQLNSSTFNQLRRNSTRDSIEFNQFQAISRAFKQGFNLYFWMYF